jgi:hypothetical protein
METKNEKTDLITTILGVLIILWACALFTYSLIAKDVIEFTFQKLIGFWGFGTYLIWFKGTSARNMLSKVADRFKKSQ